MIFKKNEIGFIYELIHTSYHESAHTICALLCLTKIDYVKIFEEETSNDLGETVFTTLDEESFLDENLKKVRIISEIYIRLSGINADKILFRKNCGLNKTPKNILDRSYEDLKVSSSIIKKHIVNSKKEKKIIKNLFMKESYNIIENNWDDISLISFYLLKKKYLSYIDLKKILTTKSNNKIFWKNQFKILKKMFINKQGVDEYFVKINFIRSKILYSMAKYA